ncbi:terminase small subunit [Bowmanella yangjiangensis]|uniref:Terminase small subunit n=1 Tax=Bowmanella yangjiangensis TaxID=2811230 RepID=A0ABS3D037_9ALTE|nr:terminase small subunit [Bowmanella yangjiangensis]MBN7822180.1 terminase small subunit [Bowmanella yangjiangensis]
MALTPKQRRFVDEYLIDLNATQAAIRAKYSARTAASIGEENLRKPEIAEAIHQRMKDREKRTEITQDMVLRELAKIGFSDIRKAVKWGETELRVSEGEEGDLMPYHGLSLVGSDQIDDDTAAAISEVSEGREGLKVKFHDKKGALVEIARHLGMFTAKGHAELDLEMKRIQIEKSKAELEQIKRTGGGTDASQLLRDLIEKLPG